MKRTTDIRLCWLAALGLLLCTSSVWAQFKMPSRVFELTELDEATAKAQERGQPIAFLLTDCESDCGITENVSGKMIDAFKSKAVIVYVPRGTKEKLPEAVSESFRQGKYIPKLSVFSNDLKTHYGTVIYEDYKSEREDAFDPLLDKLREAKKESKSDSLFTSSW